jgi:hypothetical protein
MDEFNVDAKISPARLLLKKVQQTPNIYQPSPSWDKKGWLKITFNQSQNQSKSISS